MSTTKKAARFKVGDWVFFRFGVGNKFAQIVEDRGRLGVKSRRLYRIQIVDQSGEADSFELPEDELRPALPPGKPAIMQYLIDGGLLAILRANLNGIGHSPKVWLIYTPRGEVTHTFAPEHGLVGGKAVPRFTVHEDKVSSGKKGEVVTFLTSFGLSQQEAEQVLARVGTAP